MQAVVLVPTVETLCLALFDTAAQNLLLVYFFLKVKDDWVSLRFRNFLRELFYGSLTIVPPSKKKKTNPKVQCSIDVVLKLKVIHDM